MQRTIDAALPADWPGPPGLQAFTLTEPLPREQWPALTLRWDGAPQLAPRVPARGTCDEVGFSGRR
ncbi:hypothetical protein ACWCQN_38690 [Streptomyces sp. NPDC001984]